MGVIPGTLTLGTAVALSLMRVQVGHVVIFEPAGDNLVTTTGSADRNDGWVHQCCQWCLLWLHCCWPVELRVTVLLWLPNCIRLRQAAMALASLVSYLAAGFVAPDSVSEFIWLAGVCTGTVLVAS